VVDRAFAAAGLDRQVRFEVADFATAAGLVRHGLGVAFVPASAMAPFDGLASTAVDGGLRWRVSVATPAGRRRPAAVAAFLAELVPQGGQHPGR
jgi:DNA-binding transcriptional LysR family regulator